jgi:hypothetical protein
MSTAAIVSLVFLTLVIGWLGLVFAGMFQQLRGEVAAESERRDGI